MGMSINQIRGWLLVQPRPSTVRIVTPDERHHEVLCDGDVSWMAVATSIHALTPVLIEGLNPEGKLIRAIRPIDQVESEPEKQAGDAASPLVLPTGTDPHVVMLTHFADLLAAAYRHSTDVAFERLVGMFEAVNRRSESLERSLDTTHRLLRKAWQEQIEQSAEKEPDAETGLLKDVLENFAAGQAAQHQQPNGKG
jgi:hypothetical protein